MDAHANVLSLCTLSDWSVRHIQAVFEAPTDEQSLQAIAETFSDDIEASVNGTPLNREGIENMVMSMRRASPKGLRVHWIKAEEKPRDPVSNRDGSFDGKYVISGFQQILPGSSKPVDLERHKTVAVKIESQSPDLGYDSRRIVHLAFFASNIRTHHQASL